MSSLWIAMLLASSLIVAAPLTAQNAKPRTKTQSTADAPGVTTITSFDKDHTVIGWLEIVPFESKIFHNTRMLRVLVPANYFSPHNAHRSYPVLYLQDGQNLFDEATSPKGEWHVDETVEHLVGGFKIPPMFVVGIDNAGETRSPEYLPYPDPLNGKDGVADEKNLQGKEYARFLTTEVMPFIEKRYRIARGAMNTGLGGSSYGGDIALYTALEYPGVFGHVLVESSELWIGKKQLLKDAQSAKQLPHKMYIGIGTEEASEPTRSTDIVNQVRDLEAILVKKGMGGGRLRVVIEEGGQHNEAAWSRRLPDALLFLYGQ
ncbi:MAG: alpha/beta hydrolase-fold protein [Candidatus Korobacteraceae bacterium]|jgi:predicted alpha/beta superfamily hydrolase